MLEKYRLLKNHCKWTLQVCCIFEGIFVILSLMTLKLGNSEQNCEKTDKQTNKNKQHTNVLKALKHEVGGRGCSPTGVVKYYTLN